MKFIHDVKDDGRVSVLRIYYNDPMEDSNLSPQAAHQFIVSLQFYEIWVQMMLAQGKQ